MCHRNPNTSSRNAYKQKVTFHLKLVRKTKKKTSPVFTTSGKGAKGKKEQNFSHQKDSFKRSNHIRKSHSLSQVFFFNPLRKISFILQKHLGLVVKELHVPWFILIICTIITVKNSLLYIITHFNSHWQLSQTHTHIPYRIKEKCLKMSLVSLSFSEDYRT